MISTELTQRTHDSAHERALPSKQMRTRESETYMNNTHIQASTTTLRAPYAQLSGDAILISITRVPRAARYGN